MSSSRWWFAESRFVHVWHVLQIYYQEMKTKPMCSVLELDEGMKWKWSLTFFWKMIPIKNIIVISIIWLAWAITASFYSTHANVSHVPTPPPPPPTPGVLGRVVRRSEAFPLKQCQENVQINSDVDIWTYSWKLSILELSRNKLIHFSWGRETIGSTTVFIPFSISSY